MSFVFRTVASAIIVTLIATVLLLRPGGEPVVIAAQPTLDTDLSLVPADAVGFVHIRAADLWKHDFFAGFRQTFEKAGPKALAALDARFVPKVSTFDRATGFLLLDERQRPLPFVVLRFTAPFKPDEVANTYMPNAAKTNIGGKPVYHGERGDLELYFPDNQHIVIALAGAMIRYLKYESPKSGPMSHALKLAASGKPVVASLNVAALPIPPRDLEMIPAEAKPLLKAEHVTVSLDLAGAPRIDLIAGYKSGAEAEAAEKAVKATAEFARKEMAVIKEGLEKKLYDPRVKGPQPLDDLPDAVLAVFALGAINQVDVLLANPGLVVKRNGSELTASVTLPKELVAAATNLAASGAALALPAVAKLRLAAARMKALNNLKQIALAAHNYHDTFGHMPRDILDKNGKPILSWRVAILPFIEQNALYNQFKLDEPWDSENNKPLSEIAIKVYMSPQADPPTPPGKTQYKVFAGPGTAFEPGKKLGFGDIMDGTSNTIMVVEAGEPVIWSKPDDIPFDPKKAPPKLTLPGVDNFVNVALCDGSVRTLNMKTLTEKTLKAAITRNGGEVLGPDWDK